MVGMCRCIQTDDGVTWVHIDDYRELQKRYEAEVGFESNDDIIARKGEDEIPEHDGCSGCKYEHEPAESTYCTGCTQNAIDKYTVKTNADRIKSMTDEELAELLNDADIMCKANYKDDKECERSCIECTLKWLQEKAD